MADEDFYESMKRIEEQDQKMADMEIIKKISTECQLACDYVCDHLSGMPIMVGDDFAGQPISEDDMLRGYKLILRTKSKVEDMALGIKVLTDWKTKDYLYPNNIDYFYALYERTEKEYEMYKYTQNIDDLTCIDPVPTENIQESTPQEPQLPKELRTANTQEIFTKAIDAGLMEQQGNLYKWLGQVNEFAAFVECSSNTLGLRHSNGRIKWILYKEAFGMDDTKIRNAQAAKRDYNGEFRAKPDKWDLIMGICSITQII